MSTFIRNASLAVRNATLPIYVISALLLTTSYYLYDMATLSRHYAFLYHVLASPLIAIPFGLSTNERHRFEERGYVYSLDTKAVGIYAGYAILGSVSWAFVAAYCLGDGALAAALKVLMGWIVLMGVNVVPVWILAEPQASRAQGSTPADLKKL